MDMTKTKITHYLLAAIIVMVVINFFQISSIAKKCNLITGEAVAGLNENSDKITIIEFSDFQCPYCARGAATIEQVKDAYGDKVEVVFKNFPLDSIHPNARKAAEAAECARDLGKFWEMHDKLFANQQALSVDDLKKYAGEIGLDQVTFDSCLDSGEKAAKVQADYQEGISKGVGGTPAFFIGNELISGAQPLSAFKEVIDRQLSGGSDATGAAAVDDAVAPTEPTRVEVSADDDAVKGAEDAPVTIIEFSDYQCPYCGRAHDTVKQIIEAYPDEIKFVHRDFPLSFHPQAQKAAEASECAHEQGKFWEMHDKLYENQQSLSVENFKAWAEELGLDTEQFDECLDSGKYEDEVKKDMADGQEAGVTGTPGFFINGIEIKGAQPFENFKAIIDAELAE